MSTRFGKFLTSSVGWKSTNVLFVVKALHKEVQYSYGWYTQWRKIIPLRCVR